MTKNTFRALARRAAPPGWRAFFVVTALTAGWGAAAQAADADRWAPGGAFVQIGQAHGGDTRSAGAGLIWPWQRSWALWGGRLGGNTEVGLAGWRSTDVPGRGDLDLAQATLVPTLRWRPDDGRCAWFGEVGIGLSATSRIYENRKKRFSTAFNFADHLGIGRSFGPQQQHELVLRYEHVSNAGLKEPNPGENFVQLRYAFYFR
jgi:hypothetical protein